MFLSKTRQQASGSRPIRQPTKQIHALFIHAGGGPTGSPHGQVRRAPTEEAAVVGVEDAVDKQSEDSFDVPLPGKRRRAVGRTRSWITRLGLICAPLVLIGGVAYSCGVSTGSARLVQSSTISADDASAFHLNSFPADRAAAFGVSYLSLCWTHPDAADTTATTDRLAALARMTSAGVDPGMWVDRIHPVASRRWR